MKDYKFFLIDIQDHVALVTINNPKALKMLALWKEPRQHIKKQRHYFVNNGLSSPGYGFSSSRVWM